jgi:hypothetical protein
MKYIIFATMLFTPLVVVASASPQSITNNLNEFTQPTGIAQASITERIIEGMIVVYQLTGIIFFVMALYAGFMWLTAQGNDETVRKARGYLIGAVVGLLLIVGAYGITLFVTERVSEDFGTGYEHFHEQTFV